MNKLIETIKHKIRMIKWHWMLDRRQKCAKVLRPKDYCHRVDIVGDMEVAQVNGWVKYRCEVAVMWCVNNGIYQFDIVERYVSRKDYKLHFVFGFKHAEDALAFKLGYE